MIIILAGGFSVSVEKVIYENKDREVLLVDFKEIIYEKRDGRAKITINRPEKLNAFSTVTLQEMIQALFDCWTDKSIGVVVITGVGERAFCTGGDQSIRSEGGYAAGATDTVAISGVGDMGLAEAHALVMYLIRTIPKPVIAAINGYAIGGGHVLHVVCDITIAAEHARFGQAGPRVGSFDAGLGTAYLARIVGEKKAREIWYFCRQYTAQEALAMGLVNKVVPKEELEAEVDKWCDEIIAKSPTSIAALKASFNADTDHIWGIHNMAGIALQLYYGTDESLEGRNAFMEKRPPDFSKWRK